MIGLGDHVDLDASVWTAPNERTELRKVLAEGRVLFLFYLFDFSST